MSGLDKTTDAIKKKMGLMDYPTDIHQGVNPTIPYDVNTTIQQNVKTAEPHEVKEPKQQKVKVTVYLTEEHWRMYNELCLDEMKLNGKPEKSQIICNAIECLYHSLKGSGTPGGGK